MNNKEEYQKKLKEVRAKADELLRDGMKLAEQSEENRKVVLKIWEATQTYIQMCIEHYEQGKEVNVEMSDLINARLKELESNRKE